MKNITNNNNPALNVLNVTGNNGEKLPRREHTAHGITFNWIRTDFYCSSKGEMLPEHANFADTCTFDLQNEHSSYAREQIKAIAAEIALNANDDLDFYNDETRNMIFAEFIRRHDCLMTCDLLDGMKKGYGSFARSMEK